MPIWLYSLIIYEPQPPFLAKCFLKCYLISSIFSTYVRSPVTTFTW